MIFEPKGVFQADLGFSDSSGERVFTLGIQIHMLNSTLFLALAAGSLALADGPATHTDQTPAAGTAGSKIAVVELFTSEGCSSCPPADDVVRKLAGEQDARGDRAADVIILAFHVDYWDRLGWPDRFASAHATNRQRAYSKKLSARNADRNGGGVYTPQIVVNGSAGFVGSAEATARQEITKAQAVPSPASITFTLGDRKAGEPLRLSLAVTNAPANTEVLVALVEDGLSTNVKRGENAGAVLHHDRVVRAFVTEKTSAAKSLTLTPPRDLVEANARVVALVQDAETGKVLGATERRLAAAPAAKAEPAPAPDTRAKP